jgi:predicted PurR-regulated permease PerM
MWNRKYDLIGAAVFAFILILILMFMPKAALSSETNQLNDWFEKQYNEFIAYQKEQWQQSKEQLILNKEQIVNLPETITVSVSQSFTDVSSYFQSLMSKINDK